METCHEDDDPSNNLLENLRWGTKAANSQDAIRNGKQPRGQTHGLAKLTPSKVKKMRDLYEHGATYRGLARRFGMGYTATRAAVLGITWADIG